MRRVARGLLVAALGLALILPAVAVLAWQLRIATGIWRQGFSLRLIAEGFLSWIVQVLLLVGLPLVLLGVFYLLPRERWPPTRTAP